MKDKNIMVCECSSVEHQIVFSKIYSNDEDKQIYCHIYLTDYPSFFKRILIGIKYIFGYKCKYGHWDEFILSNKHSDDLKEMSDYLKTND